MKFECPKCGARCQGKDSMAGRQVQCPRCKEKVVMTALDEPADAVVSSTSAPSMPQSEPDPYDFSDIRGDADFSSVPIQATPYASDQSGSSRKKGSSSYQSRYGAEELAQLRELKSRFLSVFITGVVFFFCLGVPISLFGPKSVVTLAVSGVCCLIGTGFFLLGAFHFTRLCGRAWGGVMGALSLLLYIFPFINLFYIPLPLILIGNDARKILFRFVIGFVVLFVGGLGLLFVVAVVSTLNSDERRAQRQQYSASRDSSRRVKRQSRPKLQSVAPVIAPPILPDIHKAKEPEPHTPQPVMPLPPEQPQGAKPKVADDTRLTDRLDAKGRFDLSKLTEKDFPNFCMLLRAADTNKNGFLEDDEYPGYARAQKDFFAVGHDLNSPMNPDSKAPIDDIIRLRFCVPPDFPKLVAADTNRDGYLDRNERFAMKDKRFLLVGDQAPSANPQSGQGTPPSTPAGKATVRIPLDSFVKNLSEENAQRARLADKDKNGFLDQDEMREYHKSRIAAGDTGKTSTTQGPRPSGFPLDAFVKGRPEADAELARQADKNKNGYLDHDEITEFHKQRRASKKK